MDAHDGFAVGSDQDAGSGPFGLVPAEVVMAALAAIDHVGSSTAVAPLVNDSWNDAADHSDGRRLEFAGRRHRFTVELRDTAADDQRAVSVVVDPDPHRSLRVLRPDGTSFIVMRTLPGRFDLCLSGTSPVSFLIPGDGGVERTAWVRC